MIYFVSTLTASDPVEQLAFFSADVSHFGSFDVSTFLSVVFFRSSDFIALHFGFNFGHERESGGRGHS